MNSILFEVHSALITHYRKIQGRVPFIGRWEDRPWVYVLAGNREVIAMDKMVCDGWRDFFQVLWDLHVAVVPTGAPEGLEVTEKCPFKFSS